jgi:hypothetical protein
MSSLPDVSSPSSTSVLMLLAWVPLTGERDEVPASSLALEAPAGLAGTAARVVTSNVAAPARRLDRF